MSTATTIDFNAFLSHEDAGVRHRAWAWQSAMGLLGVECLSPSAYLVETARRHIEGGVPLALVCQLVDIYHRSQSGAASEAADRKALDLVRMLAGAGEAVPASQPPVPQYPASTVSVAEEPPAADASSLHNRHKRLLRTLGTQTLGVPELLKALRLTTRQSFMRVWVTPAMEMGLVKALHPDSPRHPQQKYLLTRKGQKFLRQLIHK